MSHMSITSKMATGQSHLSSGRVNVGLLRECSRRELLMCLDKHPGSKVSLMAFIGKIPLKVSPLNIELSGFNLQFCFVGYSVG